MNFKDYDGKDGKKVWLSEGEVDALLEAADTKAEEIAYALGARCGLRSHEVVRVTPVDVVDTDAGPMVRVWEGKGDKFRQAPINQALASTIQAAGEYRDDADADDPIVDASTRTVRRWIDSTTSRLQEETGEPGWGYVGMHDLRRTWASSLADKDVDPLVVLEWGGWSDLETFLDHYNGAYTPEAQLRERGKVDWL